MLTYSFLRILLLCCGTGICAVATELQLSLSETWKLRKFSESEEIFDIFFKFIDGISPPQHHHPEALARTKLEEVEEVDRRNSSSSSAHAETFTISLVNKEIFVSYKHYCTGLSIIVLLICRLLTVRAFINFFL